MFITVEVLQLLGHSQDIPVLNTEVLLESERFCKRSSSYQLQVVYMGQYFETLHSLRLLQLLALGHSPYRQAIFYEIGFRGINPQVKYISNATENTY